MTRLLSRNVWVLSFVSLFTDIASEMLYPVTPIFLKSIGFSVLLIGVLEGFAEALAGLSKGYFGLWSDRVGRRLPFVQVGYTLSALSKPMLAIFSWTWWVFLARALDRLGKGVRTGARDALLSDEATPATKGRVFGFHRGMDTLGAVLGPTIAMAYLYFFPEEYRALFWIAFVPGLLAVGATFLVRERRWQGRMERARFVPWNLLAFAAYWKTAPVRYRQLVRALVVFALFNSSDVFLLLRAKEAGFSDMHVVGCYILFNAIYAVAAFPMGWLADRVGMKCVFIGGLWMFALVYIGMAYAAKGWVILLLFSLYGLYAAATEGVAKAWISNLCPREQAATAIGTYAAFQSVAALVASSFTGALWQVAGVVAAFGAIAAVAVGVALYLSASRL